jgi:nucleotide-binding universal stress UspA family protein
MSRRTILVPLDGSEFSHRIVPALRSFFDPQSVDIILFRAAYPPSLTPELFAADFAASTLQVEGAYAAYSRALDVGLAETAKERETYRRQLVDEMRPAADELERAGYHVKVEVVFGEPSERIIEYAKDEEVGLIAMTTHGRTGISRAVMGSVAERVLRGISIPVMLLRSAPDVGEEGHVEELTELQA